MKYIASIEGRQFEIDINAEGEVIADGERLTVDFHSVADQPVFSMILNGRSFEASVYSSDAQIDVLLQGQLFQVSVEEERQKRLRESSGGVTVQEGEFNLKAPMPGLIVSVPVEDGQSVEQGQNLIILESMKMQNELKAPRAGTVSRVRVMEGDNVDQQQVLLTLS